MTGAESLLRTMAAAGIEVCFANPGTSEMHFVSALGAVASIRPVLGLFEGVVSGMADGYARVAARPAMTLLHLGTGFANAGANLHNARRAKSPIVNVVGDHATTHKRWDSPLKSDIEAIARPLSDWLRMAQSAADAVRRRGGGRGGCTGGARPDRDADPPGGRRLGSHGGIRTAARCAPAAAAGRGRRRACGARPPGPRRQQRPPRARGGR